MRVLRAQDYAGGNLRTGGFFHHSYNCPPGTSLCARKGLFFFCREKIADYAYQDEIASSYSIFSI